MDGPSGSGGRAITFIPRSVTAASMPFTRQRSNTWRRRSGAYQLHIEGHTRFGVPYGRHARIFAMWLAQKTLRTERPVLELNDTFSQFLKHLNLDDGGNTRRRVYDQANRFLSSQFLLGDKMIAVTDRYELMWDRNRPAEFNLFKSFIRLSSAYYDHLLTASVPLDSHVVRSVKRSSWEMDLYSWLTWRFSYLKADTEIKYESLRQQFGCTYKQRKHFCCALKKHVQSLQTLYPGNYACTENGMILRPSATSVRKTRRRFKRAVAASTEQLKLFDGRMLDIPVAFGTGPSLAGANEAEAAKEKTAAVVGFPNQLDGLQPLSVLLSTFLCGKRKLSTGER